MLSSKEVKKFRSLGMNPITCLCPVPREEDGVVHFCGAMAVDKIEMPLGIPDMPVCVKHRKWLENWTTEDTERIVTEMLEEDDA